MAEDINDVSMMSQWWNVSKC